MIFAHPEQKNKKIEERVQHGWTASCTWVTVYLFSYRTPKFCNKNHHASKIIPPIFIRVFVKMCPSLFPPGHWCFPNVLIWSWCRYRFGGRGWGNPPSFQLQTSNELPKSFKSSPGEAKAARDTTWWPTFWRIGPQLGGVLMGSWGFLNHQFGLIQFGVT